MPKRSNYNQESFLFDGLPSQPDVYDINRAKEAARNRKKRTGYLATTKRTTGFDKRVKNLWVPQTAGENTIVVKTPEPHARETKLHAKERVKEKYSETDVAESLVRHWASFSSMGAETKLRGKYNEYLIDSLRKKAELLKGLNPDRTYSRDSLTSSDLAVNALTMYVVNLASFVGENSNENGKRVWIQENWTHKMAQAKDQAQEYLHTLTETNLLGIYDEAVQNYWSRELFWRDVQQKHQDHLKQNRVTEPQYEQVPLRAYLNTPEYQA